jgi:hypothetical protein
MVPSLNVELEMPQMGNFDYFRDCEDPLQRKFFFGHHRKRFVKMIFLFFCMFISHFVLVYFFRDHDIQHTTLWADPGDADLPNGNRCPYSLDSCRRVLVY